MNIIKRFSTPGAQSSTPGPVDNHLFEHTLKIQHQLVVDAASDERLSGREMQHGRRLDDEGIMFPGLRLVTLDHCHASGRLLSRAISADTFLKDIMEQDVRSRESMCQTIDHSPVIAEKFAEYVSQSEAPIPGYRVKNMSAAKHRYASAQKPLSRLSLVSDAVMATAAWVYYDRKGRAESKRALAYLQRCSTERLLQTALLADAADETILLTRYMDQEAADPADIPAEIMAWCQRTAHLFVNAGRRTAATLSTCCSTCPRPGWSQ